MRLDFQAQNAVFAFLRDHGYTGTQEQWREEELRQSYGSEIRWFDLIWLTSYPIREFPEAQHFVRRILETATPHFDSARNNSSDFNARISLNREAARRQVHPPRPIRLDGLTLDIEKQGERLEVRCRLYVNDDLRRDLSFMFTKPSDQKASPP